MHQSHSGLCASHILVCVRQSHYGLCVSYIVYLYIQAMFLGHQVRILTGGCANYFLNLKMQTISIYWNTDQSVAGPQTKV